MTGSIDYITQELTNSVQGYCLLVMIPLNKSVFALCFKGWTH